MNLLEIILFYILSHYSATLSSSIKNFGFKIVAMLQLCHVFFVWNLFVNHFYFSCQFLGSPFLNRWIRIDEVITRNFLKCNTSCLAFYLEKNSCILLVSYVTKLQSDWIILSSAYHALLFPILSISCSLYLLMYCISFLVWVPLHIASNFVKVF